MNNVLYKPLPTEWNGYKINTWFQIGVQLSVLFDDDEISTEDRGRFVIELLFGNEDGSVREFPQDPKELNDCIEYFMSGWYHDNASEGEKTAERIMDYDIDQWRIYADFRAIYGIDLSLSEMHWWEFQGLLWNLPSESSSFKQVIQIRTKKPTKNASTEEKKAIKEGLKVFGLRQRKKKEELTDEQITKIDAFDEMMKSAKQKQKEREEILREFRK